MAKIIKKRGKYLRGHSYCTGFGTSYSWTFKEEEARRYSDDAPYVDVHANDTKGKIIWLPNTKKELRELGKSRIAERESIAHHKDDAKEKIKPRLP